MTAHLHIAPTLALPLDAVTGTFGILATKGAGKSNAAVVMAEEMYDAGVPWVAIDPKGDWWGMRADGDGKGAGLPIVVFGGRHGDVPLEPTAGALIADLVLDQRLTCVLDVSQFTKADTIRFLTAFGDRMFRHADDDGAEPLHLFLEEAHEYLPQQVPGPLAAMVGIWQRIVKQGRFKGLGVTLISQRSSSLNKDVLELVDTLIVLRTIGPRSRDAIKQWVKDQDVDEGLLASLPKLESGEAWVWSPGDLGLMERIRFRRRRTFDSGATPKVGQVRKAPATLADVDLAAIKEQMAETIEKAKADDPKELRKQIAALKRDLAERPTVEPEVITETIEVPVVPPAVVELLKQHASALLSMSEAATTAVVTALDSGVLAAPTAPAPRQQPRPAPTAAARTVPAPRTSSPRLEGDVRLGAGERKILAAVAQYPNGVTREQLTVLTGYKRSSRDTYIQRLRQAGCVVVEGGVIFVTDVGVDVLGDDYVPLPTGAALREHWLRVLPKGEGEIFQLLIDAWPGGLDRDEISDRTGFKRSSRDTYLQRLRSRQLIDTTRGDPRAVDGLFEDRS